MPRSMNTFTIEVGMNIDKYEVAMAALNGAIGVMAAAGLSDSEITSLLLKAANLDTGEPRTEKPSEWEGDCDDEPISIYEIENLFEETSTFKALSRLSKRAGALEHHDNSAACEKIEKLIEEALPHLKDAADWYRSTCVEHGFKFEANRQIWLESASDSDLDAEDEYVFFDLSGGNETFSPWMITNYANSAEQLGRAVQLKRLLEQIIENNVLIDPNIFQEVTEAFRNASFKSAIQSQVESLDSGFEMPQADFIRTLLTASDGTVSEHLISVWIESFEEAGLLERFKRSNRWQVRRV